MVLAGSFAILVGTILLLLPWSTPDSTSLSVIDALFTATSAVCVTGLIVVDSAKDFTGFGQIVVLALIQIGGLGYATLATMLLLAIGRQIGLKDRMMVAEAISALDMAGLVKFVKAIFFTTFIIEVIGTACLTFRFMEDFPLSEALYHGIFQAVSAFNNAGFSSFSTNLIPYQLDVTVNMIIALLIILGGIGFIVLINLYQYFRQEGLRIHTHTKLVLGTTGILIVGGTLSLLFLEWNNVRTLGTLPVPDKILVAFFHAISARTAGFNTIELHFLSNASLYLIVIFMFIGGSPGGTAGGIKTTTFGVICLFVWNTLRHREDVEIFWRRMPVVIIHKALALAILSMVLLTFFTHFLAIMEEQPFLSLMFEVASALGTTGYSVGNGQTVSLSASLTSVGKLVIIFCMFIGRFGPLLVGLGAFREKGTKTHRFPEAKIAIC